MELRILPILLAFFLMGLADAMGPNSDKIKAAYHLDDVTSTLPTTVVFGAFALFSVPGGLLAARVGKKNLLLLGLGLNVAALAVPSVFNPYQPDQPAFILALTCIFVLGIGTTFLQVAGNPIMRDVSAAGNYSRNLALAQGIKGIGSSAATKLLPAIAAIPLFTPMAWKAGFPLFCGLMVLAFVSVAMLKVKETKADEPPSILSSFGLLKEPVFLLAVLGIFLYVGAEASMGRFLTPALTQFGLKEGPANTWGPFLFFLVLAIGRILGSALLKIMSPRTCFRLSAALGLVGVIALMVGSQALTFAGVVAAGLGFANIWPMLFSITVEEKPDRANELSGLMCMAISGGAVVPLLMGRLRDSLPTQMVDEKLVLTPGAEAFSFIVPAACFAYLLLLSFRGGQQVAAT